MYINSFCSIGPAGVITPDTALSSLQKATGPVAACIEPDYLHLIPAMQLRRMTRPVRTGVAAAKICMQMASANMPSSIHVGTAYGMLQDSENFLQNMIAQEEQMLNPTAFIQSTHNTVAGQIALSMGCNAHNMTFVHQAHSFESALTDATLMRNSEGCKLAGAVDECTDTSYAVLERFGIYNEQRVAGQGASFFLIADNREEKKSIARITAFNMFLAENTTDVYEAIADFCQKEQLQVNAGDLLLNGAQENPAPSFFKEIRQLDFKEYCGEFPTAAAFAIALGALHIKEKVTERCWILNASGKYYSIYCLDKV